MDDSEVYDVIGESGFRQLVGAFYRQVREDSILAPLYPEHDFEGAEQRLRDFLIFRFGGPQHYIERRGHPRLRMRHAPFPVDATARDRWLLLMRNAMAECAFPAEVNDILDDYFETTAHAMMNRE
ncbi:MAG TPA: globin [Bryobacteraceae bacterium]|nr:globin [Bryobacteraceae bacterium]